MKVILINPEMGHGPSKRLIGKSGKCYGTSRYSTQHRCQIVEMTMEAFAQASDDLWRASNMIMRRWWPTFVADEAVSIPAPVMEFCAGYNLAMDGQGLPDQASPAATLGWGYAQGTPASTVEPLPHSEPKTADSVFTTPGEPIVLNTQRVPVTSRTASGELHSMKWFSLLKVARGLEIDPKGLQKDSLIAAILLKRGHGNQPLTV